MKLLGQFNKKVASTYQDLLTEAGIVFSVEDWSNSYEEVVGIALVRLFVEEPDYEKALNIIKDFEGKATLEVEKIDKLEIGKVVPLMIAGAVLLILTASIISHR